MSAYYFLYNASAQNTLGDGEIAQGLASLFAKPAIQVRARHDPLVSDRWYAVTGLLNCSHQCRQLVKKRSSMCYYVCVMMQCKISLAIC